MYAMSDMDPMQPRREAKQRWRGFPLPVNDISWATLEPAGSQPLHGAHGFGDRGGPGPQRPGALRERNEGPEGEVSKGDEVVQDPLRRAHAAGVQLGAVSGPYQHRES